MKSHLPRHIQLLCMLAVACSLLFCGLTAFAAGELTQTTPEPLVYTEEIKPSLTPASEQTTARDGERQIIKTYILAPGESPDAIPQDSFADGGWIYELANITQVSPGSVDVKSHTETAQFSTDSNSLSDILEQLSLTLDYQSEDGYRGLLTLDLTSVKCEAAGHVSSSCTVTATREYSHLEANDLYFIPKSITENGRTLNLDGVQWEAESLINVGYGGLPGSYRVIAKYTGKATQSVATGYLTTANYTGEVARQSMDGAVYTAHFIGTNIHDVQEAQAPVFSFALIFALGTALLIALVGGAAAFYLLRYNVKVYSTGENSEDVLVVKARISAKDLEIDLSPLATQLENRRFSIVIDKLSAQNLNGKTLDVIYGPMKLQQQISYEGNAYKIEVDFYEKTIKAIY